MGGLNVFEEQQKHWSMKRRQCQLFSLFLSLQSERRAVCHDHVCEEGQATHLQAPPLPALTPGCRRCHGDCP